MIWGRGWGGCKRLNSKAHWRHAVIPSVVLIASTVSSANIPRSSREVNNNLWNSGENSRKNNDASRQRFHRHTAVVSGPRALISLMSFNHCSRGCTKARGAIFMLWVELSPSINRTSAAAKRASRGAAQTSSQECQEVIAATSKMHGPDAINVSLKTRCSQGTIPRGTMAREGSIVNRSARAAATSKPEGIGVCGFSRFKALQ